MTAIDKLLTVLFVVAVFSICIWLARVATNAEEECTKIGAVAARTTEGYTCVKRA